MLNNSNQNFYLNEKIEFNAKNISYGTAAAGAIAGSSNLLELHRLKKELKDLNNTTKMKQLYRDSTTQKSYNDWINEKRSYLIAQIKNLRMKNIAATGVTAGSLYNIHAINSGKTKDSASKGNKFLSWVNGKNINDLKNKKAVAGISTAAIGGLGIGGAIYSVKNLADTRKELKIITSNPTKAKELYKQSRSLLPFNQWKKERIDYLKRHSKVLVGGTAASLGALGLSAMSAKELLKEEFALDEFFHGKNKILEEVEDKLFGSLIKAVSHNRNPYSCRKEIKESEEILAKFFNLESIKFHIGADYSQTNAFTISWQKTPSAGEKVNYDLVENSSGIKFKDPTHKVVDVYIYPSLLTGECTKEELMAVLLHEIGHNFFVNKKYLACNSFEMIITNIIDILFAYATKQIDFKKFLSLLKELLISLLTNFAMKLIPAPVRRIYSKIIQILVDPLSYDVIGDKLHINLTPFYKLIGFMRQIIRTGVNIVVDFVSPLTALLKLILAKLLMHAIHSIGTGGLATLHYQAEKYADAFAAKFGYGKELISALDKFSDAQNILDITTHFSNLRGIILNACGLYFIDEHPTHQTRAIKLLELYKHDFKKYSKQLDPKTSRELLNQMKELEKRVKMSSDKGVIKNLQIALDKPYRAAREAIDNKLSGLDGTFSPN